jgi:hypothetical protein
MGGLLYQGYGGTQMRAFGPISKAATGFGGTQMRAFGPISKAATGFGGNTKIGGVGVGVLISIGLIAWAATGFKGL